MTMLDELQAAGRPVAGHRPWPRIRVDRDLWTRACAALAAGDPTLFALFGEPGEVHMVLLDEDAPALAVLSLACPDGRFPSVGRHHAPAIRLERGIADLFGLVAEDAPDDRPWLDHGRFGLRAPLGPAEPDPSPPAPYRFLAARGDGLHQIPVGPVHAGIIEPGQFRFHAGGETVVRLEERLGFVHKGIEALWRGADPDRAAKLAGRVSGDSTVAYACAFARALEAALEIEAPPRALWLRALMAEIERIANHLGDIGAVCNDAAFALLHTHYGILREQVLDASAGAFGHRLMMDRVVPGGVAIDPVAVSLAGIEALVRRLRRRLPELLRIYDDTASLQDRMVATGVVGEALVRRFGAGGHVGRASGRGFDSRKTLLCPPYDRLAFEVPVLQAGDVDARVRIRMMEIDQSLDLIEQILDRLPEGPVRLEALPDGAGEGLGLAEAFRGDVLVWLRIEGGRIARCHARDASWFQWPLLEAAIEGNIVADFPLCNKSFNCSYSGHDI